MTASFRPYPAEMRLVRIDVDLVAAEIATAGRFRAELERQVACTYDPKWLMTRWTRWTPLTDGQMRLTLPASDDDGLRGDAGERLEKPLGYKIYLEPTMGDPIQLLKFTELLGNADGSLRTLGLPQLANLGGWPNAVIVSGPTVPTDPGDGSNDIQLIEKSPGVWGLPTIEGTI